MKLLKRTTIITCILLIIINIFAMSNQIVSADEKKGKGKDDGDKSSTLTMSQMEDDTKEFLKKGSEGAGEIDTDEIFGDLKGLGSILTTIGAGVMVAATLYMGIRYITASPESQAKLKEQLIGLAVSGVVIFGAYSIWKIVVNIVSKF